MIRRSQLLLSSIDVVSPRHGGGIHRGLRKTARPIVTRRPMHITMRAGCATGPLSLLYGKHPKIVRGLLGRLSRRYAVRVYRFSNNGNHCHLLVQARSRTGLQAFLRVFAGQIAQKITGARKGAALGRRFWGETVFSRVVEWGRAFRTVLAYVRQNQLEALGLVPYRPRTSRPLKKK